MNMTKIDQWIVFYLDITLRSLVAFAISLVLLSILKGYFNMSIIWVIVCSFALSIMITPFLSKIRLGNYLLNKYKGFLNRTFVRVVND